MNHIGEANVIFGSGAISPNMDRQSAFDTVDTARR
jgi:hypothetical protein